MSRQEKLEIFKMINPFENHPENLDEMKKSKVSKSIDIKKLKDIIICQLEKIRKEKTPRWGYNKDHVDSFFSDLINEIEKESRKNDS